MSVFHVIKLLLQPSHHQAVANTDPAIGPVWISVRRRARPRRLHFDHKFVAVWRCYDTTEPDAAQRAAARLTRNFEIKAAGVRYLGYILGRHVAELCGWVSGIVAKIEVGFAGRGPAHARTGALVVGPPRPRVR